MAHTTPPTTSVLEWLVQHVRLGIHSVPLARVRTQVYLPLVQGSSPAPEWGWLDTAAPLSVIPYSIHSQGLSWKPLAGVRATWSGQLCELGHIDVCLPDHPSHLLHGPFAMLAKFPQSDPPGPQPPVLLGLEFLLTHRARLALDPPPGQGGIQIP